jgi:hypothetical protein
MIRVVIAYLVIGVAFASFLVSRGGIVEELGPVREPAFWFALVGYALL